MKQEIKKTLRTSWNGIAKNGTKFTQWFATENFWNLRKELTPQIVKDNGFNVYKDSEKGWLVTVFGESTGLFESYDKFEHQCFLSSKEELRQEAMGSRGSDASIYELLDEIENLKTVSEFENFVIDECDESLKENIFDYYNDLLHN